MPVRTRLVATLGIALSLWPLGAMAWTRPGHMVTAAIAYDALAAQHPAVIDRVVALLLKHPDRGPFEVAIARTEGDERARRLFYECARWPDDIRGGMYDHPTWHYAAKPVSTETSAVKPMGEAAYAFALNVRELADADAPEADRALALCWVMHIAGDIHQPLHSAQLVSTRFPNGDHLGGMQFVIDPQSGKPISLHWLWDDSVNRSDEAADVTSVAHEIETEHPRSALPELKAPAKPDDFAAWAGESYDLAVKVAYGLKPDTGDDAKTAKPVAPSYAAAVRQTGRLRAAIAGYRLADILDWALSGH